MKRHLAHWPIGDRPPTPDVSTWETFPFDGTFSTKVLPAPALPEPPRTGAGGVDCFLCDRPDDRFVWTDANWRISTTEEPTALPAVLFLNPRCHVEVADLPPDLAAELGIMIQRIQRAYYTLGDIGRVYMAQWGEGFEHLHLWFYGRPAGMLQLRGPFLSVWAECLPALSENRWRARTYGRSRQPWPSRVARSNSASDRSRVRWVITPC